MGFHYPGWRTTWNISVAIEENGFHKPENQFPLVRISYVFQNCFSRISMTVSDIRNKLSNKVDGF